MMMSGVVVVRVVLWLLGWCCGCWSDVVVGMVALWFWCGVVWCGVVWSGAV